MTHEQHYAEGGHLSGINEGQRRLDTMPPEAKTQGRTTGLRDPSEGWVLLQKILLELLIVPKISTDKARPYTQVPLGCGDPLTLA